jgi:hypothetical protein
LLERVQLSLTVDSFHSCQVALDLLVLLGGHLVVKDRLQEGNHVILGAPKVPVFRDHV